MGRSKGIRIEFWKLADSCKKIVLKHGSMNSDWWQKIRNFFFARWRSSRRTLHQERFSLPSTHLDRTVVLTLFYPQSHRGPLALLLLNDGQDIPALDLEPSLHQLWQARQLPPLLVVGIHAGDRMQEYGTIGRADYAGRGNRAAAYAQFVCQELLPYLEGRFRLRQPVRYRALAGFSLGGLSALDLVWQHPEYFGRVGVFSGSLWWRSTPFDPQRPDADRIIHNRIAAGPRRPQLRFWLQAGTHDETADRNNNGIIDAIDDTLDLIKVLEGVGYQRERDIVYEEVVEGKHHPRTWGRVMPQFLRWWVSGMK